MNKIALGCHNLTGGSSYRRSERLVHCALDLGIRRFDVAPSYGLGTAENTLAKALGRRRLDPEVDITTKFGIAPPKYGPLLAWFREPYRSLRGRCKSASLPITRQASASSAGWKKSAKAAASASLINMNLDRLGGLLTHERLPSEVTNHIRDELAELIHVGRIGRAGCSGEIENVSAMLDNINGVASIAQISVLDRHCAPDIAEKRYFQLGHLATRILEGEDMLAPALKKILSGVDYLNDVGLAYAYVLACLRHHSPDIVCIVNASNCERLSALLKGSEDPRIQAIALTNGNWVLEKSPIVSRAR
ncbi:aryl-alcohol dehydrogenase-like predicted oxidoreductase [Rhodoblastus acidophilus]|nr:aldo/keto reductase [Rhodoblastus acidophilus]MCW2333233.1 aryl-alcohol dehydrogenase-like predicted oxidoreductase [Rhodoblastus acidophilus]